jgi:hypothetical protein
LSGFQALETVTHNVGEVDKEVFAGLALGKAVALRVVKKLHDAFGVLRTWSPSATGCSTTVSTLFKATSIGSSTRTLDPGALVALVRARYSCSVFTFVAWSFASLGAIGAIGARLKRTALIAIVSLFKAWSFASVLDASPGGSFVTRFVSGTLAAVFAS